MFCIIISDARTEVFPYFDGVIVNYFDSISEVAAAFCNFVIKDNCNNNYYYLGADIGYIMTGFQNNKNVFRGIRGHASPEIIWILTLQSPLFRVSETFTIQQSCDHVTPIEHSLTALLIM